MSDSRAKYTSEEAVNAVGNRFDLILIAAQRVRELKRGYRSKLGLRPGTGIVDTALQEIEAGIVDREYLKRL
jgi:DNA-directed RNA polymerase subunit omega